MAGNRQPATQRADASMSRTLVRGITVLEAVASSPGGAGVTGIAIATGLDKGTVSRLLATLRELGYVRQRDSDRQYELGSRCLWLAQEYRATQEELTSVAQPFIIGLRDATSETVHLAIREGVTMVYVAQEQPDRQIRVSSAIGQRLPMHRTAMGRAILASMTAENREGLLRDIRADAERAGRPIDFNEIETDVAEAKVRGWAAVDRHDDVTRIAAAIRDADGDPVAAITLSGPSYRMTDRMEEFGAAVVNTAREVSRALAR